MGIYDNIKKLCDKSGITISQMGRELGFSTALLSQWKTGRQEPSRKKLEPIAEYFGVSIDYLLVGAEYIQPDLTEEERELAEYLQVLKENPGMRILFSKTKNASKEDIEKVIRMFEIMKGDNNGGNFY